MPRGSSTALLAEFHAANAPQYKQIWQKKAVKNHQTIEECEDTINVSLTYDKVCGAWKLCQ